MTDGKALDPSNQSPDSYARLHVTPLDAELLKIVVSSALLPKARNISYHTIETFPEKRYGFLELPNEDAEKLRKKLNGSVLKGVKIRIERARPSRIPAPLGNKAMAKEKRSKKAAEGVPPPKDKTKKRKRGAEELSGVVLEEGRKIKRGWTTADEPREKRSKKDKEKKLKDKKKQPKSKYTDHPECLVKTILPANAAPTLDADPSTPAKKKKKGKSREVVVHEFEKTTKFPTFLKSAAGMGSSKPPPQYVDGNGWVDEHGNVVEAVKARSPPAAKILLWSKSEDKPKKAVSDDESSSSSSDGEAEAEDESSDERAEEDKSEVTAPAAEDSSASSDAESESASASPSLESEPQRPKSSGSTKSLSITIPPTTPNEPKVVHPLEALYKRQKPADCENSAPAPKAQGFSFFAGGEEEDEEEDGADVRMQVPLTPFTRQDLELRGIRSAAPTPDTAHPNRSFKPWEHDDDDEDYNDNDGPANEDFDEEMGTPSRAAPAQLADGDGNHTSDFQKWFWENRGDLNRSWKKRRKLAGKEKRYRENKARMARAI
ncbi:hypothetical protein VTI74DRAFT_9644 [Chaetomium olivicolor]